MKRFFDMDGPIMSGLAVAADLLLLNLLTLLCSLPIITIGAAFTAMYDQCIHIVRGEGSSVVKGYFQAFASNLKKGTIFGLILLAAAALLYFDYLAALAYIPFFRIGIVAISLIVLAVFQYIFALLARYENTVWGTIKNAAALAVGYFPRTLLMVMFTTGLWMAGLHFIRLMAPVLLMFGLSLPCYVSCLLLTEVFRNMEK